MVETNSNLRMYCLSTAHKVNAPRFRIIIPLSRDIRPDEYNAVARFDPVSFRSEQLMFWPICLIDAEYKFIEAKAEKFLKPDEILAKHPEWKDVTTLPRLESESPARAFKGKKAEDPLTKERFAERTPSKR